MKFVHYFIMNRCVMEPTCTFFLHIEYIWHVTETKRVPHNFRCWTSSACIISVRWHRLELRCFEYLSFAYVIPLYACAHTSALSNTRVVGACTRRIGGELVISSREDFWRLTNKEDRACVRRSLREEYS